MNTRIKIALLLIASNAILLLMFGGSVYYFLQKYSYTDFYKRLDTRANIAAKCKFEADKTDAATLKKLREEHLEILDKEREYITEILPYNDLSSVADKTSLPASLISNTLSYGKANENRGNTFYSAVKYNQQGRIFIVAVSAKNYYATHHLVFLRNIIVAGLLFILLVIIGISVYFTKHIYDPIRNITDKVNTISTNNIHLRLEELSSDDEVNTLVSTFNSLLDRMETTFETHKNFISNASHEIATPLTSIIGEADVALLKHRSNEEYREALRNILQQAERLNQISESLLFLAQTGYKENKLNLEILRTDELIWEAIGIMDKLIPKHHIQFDLSLLPENPLRLKVTGNRQLLLLAFTNLFTNACKYSGNKQVNISIASTDEEVILLFQDNGIGIPQEDLPYIYDPFFRASNTQHFDGYGIGLPLTRNIIKIHKGSIAVSSAQNKGTTVQVKLPLAKL